MSNRTLDRSVARALYADFSKRWRRELRGADVYGKPGSPKKPKFSQWYAMHERDLSMMKESTPQDVAEYMEDPWATPDVSPPKDDAGERGVVEIPIEGDDVK